MKKITQKQALKKLKEAYKTKTYLEVSIEDDPEFIKTLKTLIDINAVTSAVLPLDNNVEGLYQVNYDPDNGYPLTEKGVELLKRTKYHEIRESLVVVIIRDIMLALAFVLSLVTTVRHLF